MVSPVDTVSSTASPQTRGHNTVGNAPVKRTFLRYVSKHITHTFHAEDEVQVESAIKTQVPIIQLVPGRVLLISEL